MLWLLVVFISFCLTTGCAKDVTDIPDGLIITAAHIDESAYPNAKLLYKTDELDTAYYWTKVGAYEYGPFRMESNKGSYSVTYNEDYVFTSDPKVGSYVTFAGYKAKVVSNSDKSFNVEMVNGMPYTGLSGSNVKYKGVTIGIVSSYIINGEIKCQKVR